MRWDTLLVFLSDTAWRDHDSARKETPGLVLVRLSRDARLTAQIVSGQGGRHHARTPAYGRGHTYPPARRPGSPGCSARCAHDISRHAARDALWPRRHPHIDESHWPAGVSGQPRTPAASRTSDGALVARKPSPAGAQESAQSSLVDSRPAWPGRAGWS